MVEPIRMQTINELTTQTKAAWDRADEKKAGADEWYIRTGQLLIELKERVYQEQGHGHWLATLKKVGRSKQRAHELIKLAEGSQTLKQQRERARHGMKKKRAKVRNVTDTSVAEKESSVDAEQPLDERWQYSLANLCGDIIAIAPYWNKHFSGWEEFDCPSHIRKLMMEAATEFASIVAIVNKQRNRKAG